MRTPFGNLPANDLACGKINLLLRPDAIYLDERGEMKFRGKVLETSFRGNLSRTIISMEGTNLHFDFPSQVALPREGENVIFSFNMNEAVQAFKDDQNK